MTDSPGVPSEPGATAPPAVIGETSVLLLDGFRLTRSGVAVALPPQGQRLVGFLGLRRTSTRDQAAGSLWPDASEAHAHGSLRSTLWRVQKSCPGLIVHHGGQLSLGPAHVDVHHWTRLALLAIDRPTEETTGSLSLTPSGALLPGWYDDWVIIERERLRQLHLHALESVAEQLAAQGRNAAALEAALRAVASDPLRESAHRLVIRIHLAEGNAAEALRQYELCRRMLHKELGIAPSAALRDLLTSVASGIRDATVDSRSIPERWNEPIPRPRNAAELSRQ